MALRYLYMMVMTSRTDQSTSISNSGVKRLARESTATEDPPTIPGQVTMDEIFMSTTHTSQSGWLEETTTCTTPFGVAM